MNFPELLIAALGIFICTGTVLAGERLGGRGQQFAMLAVGTALLASGLYRL